MNFKGKYEKCCLCGKYEDKEGNICEHFAVSGKGNMRTVNFFHRSCYNEHTRLAALKRGELNA